jgi:hypothetical protein
MGGTGFSPIYFEHDFIQRLKWVLKNTDAAIDDITSFFIVLKPLISPTYTNFERLLKSCDIHIVSVN